MQDYASNVHEQLCHSSGHLVRNECSFKPRSHHTTISKLNWTDVH